MPPAMPDSLPLFQLAPPDPVVKIPQQTYAPPPDTGLALCYQDEHCLVVNKPSGLLSVPGRGADKADCMVARVRQTFPDAIIVHRLDMATSGLLLLARSKATERTLSLAFQRREVHKRYEAVVAGLVAAPSGEINLPLSPDWENRPLQKIDPKDGKPSKTRFRVLAWHRAGDSGSPWTGQGDCTRVELEPVTGRSHQLRLHMQALGHPLLGDEFYAPPEIIARASRLLLHASWLDFPHPVSGERLQVSAPAPF